MQHTPWTQKVSGGSLPSDRLRPPQPRAQPPNAVKGKAKAAEPTKSADARRLEELLNGLRASTAGEKKDPKGGCFCQGTTFLSATLPEHRVI
jgi:hypothetical protein